MTSDFLESIKEVRREAGEVTYMLLNGEDMNTVFETNTFDINKTYVTTVKDEGFIDFEKRIQTLPVYKDKD